MGWRSPRATTLICRPYGVVRSSRQKRCPIRNPVGRNQLEIDAQSSVWCRDSATAYVADGLADEVAAALSRVPGILIKSRTGLGSIEDS